MVASYAAQHLFSRSEKRIVDLDPDTGNDYQAILNPVTAEVGLPIANFRRFCAMVAPMTGAMVGGITAFQILAYTSAAGAGAVAVVSHAVGSNPDAVTDYLTLECDVEQIREVLATATHVGVLVNYVTGTDEGKLFFERAEPFYPASGLTADYVA